MKVKKTLQLAFNKKLKRDTILHFRNKAFYDSRNNWICQSYSNLGLQLIAQNIKRGSKLATYYKI